MKKQIFFVTLLMLLIGVCAAPVWAQLTGTVKGTAKDDSGKPITGANVQLINLEKGNKVELKTNGKGEFFSIAVPPGTYKANLIKDGQVIDELNNIPIAVGDTRELIFDLAKDKASAAAKAGISDEQRKKMEEVQQQNQKIKGLNAQLAQARQLETAGNYDQAVTILQQASQVDPNQDLIWAHLGEAQRGAKKYPDAVTSYQKAIALKPNVADYHDGLADAYAKSGQTDKAVQEYAAAAQADPTKAATYYYNEGAIFTNTGKVDEAIAAFDKAIQADPNRADAYYWKGVNLVGKATTKGDKMVAPEGTAEALTKYLSLEPNGKYAQGAKDILATLGSTVETSYGKSKSTKKKP
jgi:tetratricopeptide (TPR) repeat protein